MRIQAHSLLLDIKILLALLALTLGGGTPGSGQSQLLWSDEFNSGTAPNSAVWNYDLGGGGWGNSELQTYTSDPSNVRVENGTLVITAVQTLLKGGRSSYTSARINTKDKLTFLYGTVEARIMVPNLANGLWPAFWTLGNNFSTVGWPNCGEIDILEMGYASAISAGVVNRRVGSAAHWNYNGTTASSGLTYDAAANLNGAFHLFRLDWTPTTISTFLDGQLVWQMDISNPANFTDDPFHKPQFITLNLAVGGSLTGITLSSGITAPFPAQYVVDYIRIYDNGYTVLGGSALGGSATSMHVASITTGYTGAATKKKATATVTIVDNTGAPVANATVTGTFSGSHNQTVSATTGSNGSATLTTTVTSSTVAFTCCVNSVTHSTLTYDSTANVVTCASY
jgi:beta-glucanase (GH16 family)